MTEAPASAAPSGWRLRVAASLLALVLLLLLLRGRSLGDVVEHVRTLAVGSVAAAVMLAMLAIAVLAGELGRTYSLLGGRPSGRLDLMVEAAEVELLNFLLPLSGSARRLSTAERRHGITAPRLAGGLIALHLSRAAAAVVLIVAGGIAGGPGAAMVAVATVLVVAATAALVQRGSRAPGLVLGAAHMVVALLPLGIARLVLLAVRLGIIVVSTGVTPDVDGLFLAAGLAALATAVPFLPSGIGLRESALVAAAAGMGITADAALAVALADRGVMVAGGGVMLAAATPARRVSVPRRQTWTRTRQGSPATE